MAPAGDPLHIRHRRKLKSKQSTIDNGADAALLEGHDVLCERASLVREDVFNLSEFLVQRGGARLCRCVTFSVIHLTVPVDEVAVAQTYHLHTECEEKQIQKIKIKLTTTHSMGVLGGLGV